MRAKEICFCFALLGFFAHFTVSQAPMNIYQIVEFLLGCTGLMARADGLRNYAIFMDESLRTETEYVLARIRGFARDRTQAHQWEETARQFFRFFVLRLIALQGRAHLDAHFAQSSRNSSEPHMLLEQCARQVDEQIAQYFDEDFAPPHIDDVILLYELSYIMRLRVMAIARDTPPYFQLRLTSPAPRRFFDENQPSTSASIQQTSYAPLENFIQDWVALYNFYATFEFYPYYYKLSNDYVSADVYNNVRTCSSDFLALYNGTREEEELVIDYTLVHIMMKFLSADYDWLACHPAYNEYAENDVHATQLIEFINRAQTKRMLMLRTKFLWLLKANTLWIITENFIELVENFQTFLEARGVVARYTRRAPFIAIRFLATSNATDCG